ncbi:MAG TPA: hypothetical protein VFT46_07955 [Holophagaceae bacterium]|nr:hypothetical protein [Holophagaceae bacterium]
MLPAPLEDLKERVQDLASSPWEGAGTVPAGAALAAMGLMALVEATSREGWVPVLDSLNLVFHEAGHPVFGLFGWETLAILGGTLMQVLVPVLVAGAAWSRRQAAGTALASAWAFQNLHNIARYMADARAQVLPLVGGGEHDWFNLFVRWGCLDRDTAIAATTHTIGWLGMAGSAAWLAWRWLRRAEADSALD